MENMQNITHLMPEQEKLFLDAVGLRTKVQSASAHIEGKTNDI